MTAPVWVEIAVSLASLLGNGFFLYQLLRHFLARRVPVLCGRFCFWLPWVWPPP